tara:strand:- start:38 stop:388 length:351 start_codon:yes stop_codon:yes gene_type:complete
MENIIKIDKKGKFKHNQNVASTLTGGAHSGSNHSDMDLLMIRDGRDNRGTLRAGRVPELGVSGYSIRRLTPVECERLQAFPDNWTEEVSNTQRYKCLGNAVTTNVITFLMDRIYNE